MKSECPFSFLLQPELGREVGICQLGQGIKNFFHFTLKTGFRFLVHGKEHREILPILLVAPKSCWQVKK